MRYSAYLYRLAFAAVRQAPQLPLVRPCDTLATVPEDGCATRIRGVAVHLPQLAAFDLVG